MPNAERVVVVTGAQNATKVIVVDTPVNATYVVTGSDGDNARKVRIVTSGVAEKMYFVS